MTLAAFLAWEERQERPWEFDGFAPVAGLYEGLVFNAEAPEQA